MEDNKPVVLSGMRPSGRLHLGNYLGALKNWIALQDSHRCYFFIADWHALTTEYEDTAQLRENIREMLLDWLSAGLDPERAVIFRQSQILEHAELYLLFHEHADRLAGALPTFKEQLRSWRTTFTPTASWDIRFCRPRIS